MDFLSTPNENISKLKESIKSLVQYPNDLRLYLKDNGTMILDVLYDTITDPRNIIYSHASHFNLNQSDDDILRKSFFILSNLAWADVIQTRFITPSIDLYLITPDTLLRKEIIYFLINIYYDDEFSQILLDNGFSKCLPRYIHDWDLHLKLKRGYIEDTSEVNILLQMLQLYIKINPEYNVDTMNTYHKLFDVCSNLSFNNIHDYKLIDVARTMYFKYPDASQLHIEIIFFLSNVYIDDNVNVFVPDYDKYANHFITTYESVYDDTIMDILEYYKPNEFVPSVLDVAMQLLRDNLENTNNHNRILRFYRYISNDKDSIEYICNHSITKRMIRHSIQIGMHVFFLSRIFSYFTSHKDTELPCEFYYNQFIVPFERVQIYPSHTLFSLTNILAVQENYSFIDITTITKFLTWCFSNYNDDSRLYTDLYHTIFNLYEGRHLHYILHDSEFVNALKSWMYEIEYANGDKNDAYDIIKYICKTISQHDELQYLFNTEFTGVVLALAHKTCVLHDTVERYLNCTLQQKCALLLYKKNMIKSDELAELDIHIHWMA